MLFDKATKLFQDHPIWHCPLEFGTLNSIWIIDGHPNHRILSENTVQAPANQCDSAMPKIQSPLRNNPWPPLAVGRNPERISIAILANRPPLWHIGIGFLPHRSLVFHVQQAIHEDSHCWISSFNWGQKFWALIEPWVRSDPKWEVVNNPCSWWNIGSWREAGITTRLNGSFLLLSFSTL